MSIKLVLDSSADLTTLPHIPFAYAPLKIATAEREFVDNDDVRVTDMVEYLCTYKGRSSTSCPNAQDWLTAFGDADQIICITITGGLSGSYNSARAAKELYEDARPGARVEVIDSLTAGPEIALMAEKAAEQVSAGKDMDTVLSTLKGYKTELLFVLESLKNFANNGRVSKAAATAAGIFGIRAVGRASNEGTLEVLTKARGEGKAMDAVLTYLSNFGYKEGKIRIDHCQAEETVKKLVNRIRTEHPKADILVRTTRALCSYYAEKGGYLVGFEV